MPNIDIPQIVLLLAAGLGAGLINTIVGSGSLISFPALLALGFPPVTANVTNNVGVLPGSISGAVGYRHELPDNWRSVIPLVVSAAIGGVAGALALLALPAEVFHGLVPALIAVACVLVIIGPTLKRRIAARRISAQRGSTSSDTVAAIPPPGAGEAAADNPTDITNGTPIPRQSGEGISHDNRSGLITATTLTGVYGGYFGAAQGVILLSLLSILLEGSMQQANAVKNMLAAAANFAAGIVFVALTPIHWFAAGIIAVGAVVGGQIGARAGRRIPELALRITIVVVGIIAIIALLNE